MVAQFIAAVVVCLTALRREYGAFERPAVDQPMVLLPRDAAGTVRSGVLDALGRFQLHGRGCRFELTDGSEVDVDWAFDGTLEFDSWKIWMFARSVGRSSIDREAVRAAAQAAPALKQINPDLFTLASDTFSLSRDRD
ncbi:DUF6896 domain-containing protein [Agromyces arachidis]|uniref:DUF6896 domain-containing protein n=1 Tax=Agromyces arachidis TaxID=766966 RepID=UPI004056D25F